MCINLTVMNLVHLETIAISKYLAENVVNYLRVHNVEDHQRFFVTQAYTLNK